MKNKNIEHNYKNDSFKIKIKDALSILLTQVNYIDELTTISYHEQFKQMIIFFRHFCKGFFFFDELCIYLIDEEFQLFILSFLNIKN